MSFINDFPYTDFHELNLDWFLKKFKDLTNLVYNIEKKLTEKIDKIPSNLSNIICVNDYGAKGDGITDDTISIQKCIKDNPNSLIIFKKGIYIISDTIHIYSATGGQTIDLGGSILKYGDAASPKDRNTPMIITDLDDGTQNNGKSCIKNGIINGNMKIGIGVQNITFYTTISDIRIVNFTHIGILNGKLDTSDVISSQMLINNVTINQIIGDWSLEDTYGMYFTYPDNIINNVNINRFGVGICVRTGGNEFSNIHTTLQFRDKTIEADKYNGINIKHYPFSGGQKQINTFNNCYFNAGKYVIFNAYPGFSGSTIILNNCQYTFYASSTILIGETYAYVMGGKYPCFLHADNFESHHGENITLLGLYPNNYNVNSLAFSFLNTNKDSTVRGNILDCGNGGHYKTYGFYTGLNIESNKCIQIGVLIKKINISVKTFPYSSVILSSYGGQRSANFKLEEKWFTSENKFSDRSIIVENEPITFEIDDKTYLGWKIYLANYGSCVSTESFKVSLTSEQISGEYYLYPVKTGEYIDIPQNVTKIV